MLRNQSALAVREPHKAALWGFVQQALATFSEHPDTLHQPAVRKVLRDNLLLAMGNDAGRSAADGKCRERQPPELPPPRWRRRANMCWKTARSR